MKRLLSLGLSLTVVLIITLVASPSLVLAQPDRVSATNDKSGIGVIVTIPTKAVEVADGVFSLGVGTDVDGRVVQGFMFVDKGYAKPPGAGGGKGGGASDTKCYAFLAKGAKWKTIEPWVVNTANTEGLNDSFVSTNLGASIQKWEDSSSANILGGGSTTTNTLVADTVSPDGVNEVYFGDIDSPGAIAVAIVWGIFAGPPSQRQLVEWDQVYDQVDFNWSSTGQAGMMDFENIATHELGHSVGMGHPDDSCINETMYRFALAGETKKRDLNAGDITGINALY